MPVVYSFGEAIYREFFDQQNKIWILEINQRVSLGLVCDFSKINFYKPQAGNKPEVKTCYSKKLQFVASSLLKTMGKFSNWQGRNLTFSSKSRN